MILEQFGIRLIRLRHEDIELVRHWRNQPEIRKRMAFKKYITKKMQESWFKSIDNKLNYYFIIEYKEKKIGVINAKNVNLKDLHGEGGIFIWEKSEDEFAAVLASLCLLNSVFFELKLFNKSFVQILRNNPAAIFHNRSLGYLLVPGQEKNKNPYYILTKEDFIEKAARIQKIAQKLSGDYDPPRITGETSDKNLDEINQLLTQG